MPRTQPEIARQSKIPQPVISQRPRRLLQRLPQPHPADAVLRAQQQCPGAIDPGKDSRPVLSANLQRDLAVELRSPREPRIANPIEPIVLPRVHPGKEVSAETFQQRKCLDLAKAFLVQRG